MTGQVERGSVPSFAQEAVTKLLREAEQSLLAGGIPVTFSAKDHASIISIAVVALYEASSEPPDIVSLSIPLLARNRQQENQLRATIGRVTEARRIARQFYQGNFSQVSRKRSQSFENIEDEEREEFEARALPNPASDPEVSSEKINELVSPEASTIVSKEHLGHNIVSSITTPILDFISHVYYAIRSFLRGRRQRLVRDRLSDTANRAALALDVGGRQTPWTRTAALSFDLREPMALNELDVERSISATIDRGGYFTPVWCSRSRPVEYIALLHRRAARDLEYIRARDLLTSLTDAGVNLTIYTYTHDPRFVYETSLGSGYLGDRLGIADVFERHPTSRLIIVSDGFELVNPFTLEPEGWLRKLDGWKHKALLTSTPLNLWGHVERGLVTKAGFSLGSSRVQYVSRLAELLRQPEAVVDPGPGIVVGATDKLVHEKLAPVSDVEPSESDSQQLIAELKTYLGAIGFEWLAGCAFYPELRTELARAIYRAVVIDNSSERARYSLEIDKHELEARMFNLPWFRLGYLPTWLRFKIISNIPKQKRKPIRRAVESLFIPAARERKPASVSPVDTIDHSGDRISIPLLMQGTGAGNMTIDGVTLDLLDDRLDAISARLSKDVIDGVIEQHKPQTNTDNNTSENNSNIAVSDPEILQKPEQPGASDVDNPSEPESDAEYPDPAIEPSVEKGTSIEGGASQIDEMDAIEPFDVYISYDHKDETQFGYAAELAKALDDAGITYWYDKSLNTESRENWNTSITRRMEKATIIIALWTPLYLSRPMCRFESTYATGAEKLLPVALEEIRQEHFTEELAGLTYTLSRVEWDVASLVEQVKALIERDAAAKKRRELRRKLAPASEAIARLAKDKVRLPAVLTSGSGFLAGRDREESLLLDAWASCAPEADDAAKTHILVLHAIGGAGKTALMRRLVDRLAETDFPHAEKVLGWSAYSQGSGENRNADSENFIIDALRFMGELGELPGDAIARARQLAARLKETRTLLLLDGIEPLQSWPDVDKGRLKDKGLQRLIQDLALGHPGLVVITSRQHLPELENKTEPAVRSRALDSLSPRAGAQLLRHLGCWGAKTDMQKAVEEVQGHALSVTLLGTYIDAVEAGDIARRNHLRLQDIVDTPEELAASEQTARLAKRAGAIMAGYIARFEALQTESKGRGEVERMLLSIVGLFDRPADGGAVRALLAGEPIPGLTDEWHAASPAQRDQRLRVAKSRLRELKLLGSEDEADPDALDAHPVVRNHFGKALQQNAPDTWRAAHERLYRHYASVPEKDYPDTLAEMQPLFHAINHGCKAGRVQEAFSDIVMQRLWRDDQAYIVRALGAFGAFLGVLAHFFDVPWGVLSRGLDNPHARGSVLNYASFCLRALGRLVEAEASMAAGLALDVQQENWSNAAISAGNVSELHLTIGRIAAAINAADDSVSYADRSGDRFHMMTRRAFQANALAQGGQAQRALSLFKEAETLAREMRPTFPRLYSVSGYEFFDLLLDYGRPHEVRARVEREMGRVSDLSPGTSQLDRALVYLADARALAMFVAHGADDFIGASRQRFDEAVRALRMSGSDEQLPKALLARAQFYRQQFERSGEAIGLRTAADDLAELHDIASRGSMGLHLADWHLESARLCLAQIHGALPESLVPITDDDRNAPSSDQTSTQSNRGSLFGRRTDKRSDKHLETNENRNRPDPIRPVSSVAPRTSQLTAEEFQLHSAAEAHYTDAFAHVQETGYHRRDPELQDLRERLDALSSLG